MTLTSRLLVAPIVYVRPGPTVPVMVSRRYVPPPLLRCVGTYSVASVVE